MGKVPDKVGPSAVLCAFTTVKQTYNVSVIRVFILYSRQKNKQKNPKAQALYIVILIHKSLPTDLYRSEFV